MADARTSGDSDVTIESSWERAHQMLVGLARKRAGLDLEEGTWLLAAARERVDRRLGFASFVEYAERLFGYAARLTQEKLRVAEALEQLPELAASLGSAETCWSAVRELTRVATPQTERAWLEAARGRSARDVEQLVSGRARGSLPTDPADDRLRKHVLRFEVSGEVLATFRDATTKLRRDAGGALDDDALLLLMARHVLGGPLDEGRASYQIELSVCEDCQRARQQAGGELVEVTASAADMARCDAQLVPATHVGAASEPATHVGAASEPATHVGAASAPATHVSAAGKTKQRATQDVPPALRREVLRRDRRSCQLPGCRHTAFLDLHHLCSREEGGKHDADNLLTLCGAHHRAAHDGELRIEGSVSAGISFKHADGTDYGALMGLAAPVIGAQAKAFRALRHLGFGEREARQVLAEVLEKLGPDAGAEARLRAALEWLTARAFRSAS